MYIETLKKKHYKFVNHQKNTQFNLLLSTTQSVEEDERKVVGAAPARWLAKALPCRSILFIIFFKKNFLHQLAPLLFLYSEPVLKFQTQTPTGLDLLN